MAKTVKDQLGVDLPEVQTPQVTPPATQEEPPEQRPEWLPEKFKTAEDFASSYSNLEKELSNRAQREREMETRLEALTAAVESIPKNEPTPNQGDVNAQLLEAFESNPLATIAYLADQAAEAKVDARLKALQEERDPREKVQAESNNQMVALYVDNSMRELVPDWNEYRDKVGDALQADNSLIPDTSTPERIVAGLQRVYKMVKADEIISSAEAGTFVTEQMKRNAQTLSGGGVRQQAVDPADEKLAQLQAATKGSSYSAWRG